jgi:hypothetical protein
MREADAVRLPGIIERRFFPDEAILTFASAPGTHNLHGDLTFLTCRIQQEPRHQQPLMTQPPKTTALDLTIERLCLLLYPN